jgi:hypothetical protein
MNLSLVFSSPEEQACILYHKHFRELAGTTVVKQDVMEGEDTLVLPLPSSFGIFSPKSFLNEIVIHLGKQVQLDMVNYIVRKYAGEQPVGSAFIIKIPPNSTPTPTRFRFLVVVSLFRAVTCRGDNYAWLDPRYVPLDFAYTAMRGVLLKILQHNAVSKTPIKIVYFPDFWKVLF